MITERQRDELLAEIYRASGTVGRSIPETVRLDGESVPLRDVYFEVAGEDDLSAADRESVEELLARLRRRRLALVQRIEDREVDYERGRSLVSEVRALDRAINAFESFDEPRFEEQLRREKLESARELLDFVRTFGNR